MDFIVNIFLKEEINRNKKIPLTNVSHHNIYKYTPSHTPIHIFTYKE